jgi:ABC-type nitrate/sulfonate/bicarbonate transport system permease component
LVEHHGPALRRGADRRAGPIHIADELAGRPAALRALLRRVEPGLVVLAALALWELLTRGGVLPSQDLPPFTSVISALAGDMGNPFLWQSIATTMTAWGVGIAVVVAVAVPLGMLLGLSRPAYRASHLSIEFVRTIPSTAAIPLLILLYGTGYRLTVVMVILGAIWPLLIQTMYGVNDVDPVTRDAGRAYGLNRMKQFTRIVLPSALPYVATGLRLSAVIGLILAIAASLVAGGDGLGGAIASAAGAAATEVMYGRILVAGVLGLVVTYAFTRLERRMLFWHPSHRVTQL